MPIRMLLMDFIRDRAGLTGTHVGCTYEGVCGACTVHLDGEAVKSCLMLAVQADGHAVTTIEGLARNGELSPLQKSFNDHHALQCGYCTPGILMNMAEFLEKHPDPTDEEIRARADRQPVPMYRLRAHRRRGSRSGEAESGQLSSAPLQRREQIIPGSEQMAHPMDTSTADGWFGAKFNRKEDRRLTTGRGQLHRRHRGAGHAAPRVRAQPASPMPGSRASTRADAKAMPGVVAVITGEDIKDQIAPLPQPVVVPNMPAKYPTHWPLAVGKVRFHGERSRPSSRATSTWPRTPPRRSRSTTRSCPMSAIPRRRSQPGAPIVHEGWDNNLIFEMTFTGGATPEEQKKNDAEGAAGCSTRPTSSSASASAVTAAASRRWRPAARSACGTTPTA